jgi:hypothetical protein
MSIVQLVQLKVDHPHSGKTVVETLEKALARARELGDKALACYVMLDREYEKDKTCSVCEGFDSGLTIKEIVYMLDSEKFSLHGIVRGY